MAVICNLCPVGAQTHLSLPALQTHIKIAHFGVRQAAAGGTSPRPKPAEPPVSAAPPPKKPLVLEYRWTGQCPDCFASAETHQIRVADGLYLIAWCGSEKKQIKDIKVIPLEEMSSYLNSQSKDRKAK